MSRLAYFEWSADEGADPEDPEAWAQANPALGIRISPDAIRTELVALESEDFARERLGIFPDVVEIVEPIIPPVDWAACKTPESKPVDPVVFGFEVSHDRAWSNIAVGAPSTMDGTHAEIIENEKGTGWVIDRLIELRDTHSPRAIVCLPSGPAGGLLAEAERKALKVGVPDGVNAQGEPKYHAITAGDYAQACAAAYDAITEHRWRHLGQGELDKAVSNAEKRNTGDTWVFDRRGNVDISPLASVTLAAWVASLPVEEPAKEPNIW